MNVHTRRTAWMFGVITVGFVASALGQSTQPAGGGGLVQGKIKGTNVNVRAGSDTNYYVVTKLNRGDTVSIVRELFNWIEILPPQGCFSVVDKNYVEKADNTGTLNGDAWAYAGSLVEERHYAKQVQLKKGEKIQIIGETSDGKCYKINPPEGATVWVSGEFVDRPGGAAKTGTDKPTGEKVSPGELNLSAVESTTKPAPEPALTKTTAESQPSMKEVVVKTEGLDAVKPDLLNTKNPKHQSMITNIESKIGAEHAKPAAQRNFEQFIKDLQPLASQSEDEVAKLYAETRIKQIRSQVEAAKALQELKKLRADAVTEADAMRAELEKLRQKKLEEHIVDWIDVRGVIQMSGIYDGAGGRPKRWRVVEPGVTPAKTLAYIEVPEGSSINPSEYERKYVAIKAEVRKQIRDTAPPVPIYLVREISVAEPPARGTPPAGAMTQPSGPIVK
jgi:SH3-like domain-containing protein